MRRNSLLSLIVCLFMCLSVKAVTLGTWTHYYAYNNLTHVVPTGNYVFALSSGRLYSYAPGKIQENQLYEYNTTNLLNDYNYIEDICFNQATNSLIIVYEGGNIDVLDIANSSVTNISSIKNSNNNLSKKIIDIHCNGKYAYLTMSWGVVIVNIQKKEITNHYKIDDDNNITGCYVEGDNIYVVASSKINGYSNSIICGNLKNNLFDKEKWNDKIDSDKKSEIINTINSAKQGRNIYKISNSTVKNETLIYDKTNDCYWGSNDANNLKAYNKIGSSKYEETNQPDIRPDGPDYNDFRTIYWKYNKLYTVGGTWNRYDDSRKSNVVQTMHFKHNVPQWDSYNTDASEISSYKMVGAGDISIDPRDTSHVMVSSRSGLYEFKKGVITNVWNHDNSPIKSMEDGKSATFQMVLTAQYDKEGNLYVANSYCSNGLLMLDKNNEWKTFHSKYLDDFTSETVFLSNFLFDNNGTLWFINQNWDNTCFYNFNPQSEKVTRYKVNENQDGKALYPTYDFVRDLSIDSEGNVWVAGTQGLTYKPYNKDDEDITYQYKVNRNDNTGLADYLMSNVNCSCIIFDSAGRMYIGTTGNGVFIISADRNEQLANYNTDNSCIMSNNVFGLAIDDATGELYISTDVGLCSLHTDAIQVKNSLSKDNLKVYPNPVTPDYTGPITIEGLTVGADIIITTASGAVVHRGRSTAGMYQWDGCDQSGNRCASGVYNILLATSEGESGCVGKIAMVK